MYSILTADVANALVVNVDSLFSELPIFKVSGEEVSDADLESFHIYFICRRNRLRFSEARFNSTTVSGMIREFVEDTTPIDHQFSLDLEDEINHFDKSTLSVEAIEKGSCLCLRSEAYSLFMPIQGLSPKMVVTDTSIFDMEVLYIGQSQEKGTAYNTLERLRNHKRMVQIYTDNNRECPHKEVILVMLKIEQRAPGMLAGLDPKAVSQRGLMEELVYGMKACGDHKSLVDYSELTLINYFQTDRYNEKFIRLTSTSMKIKKLRKNKVGRFGFMLDTKFFNVSLYSEKRASSQIHQLLLNVNTLQVENNISFDAKE